jgi:dTDP-glucose pyrophosphorylase
MDPIAAPHGGLVQRVVGLVPAAGRGRRLGPAPCSKEIFPIGFRSDEQGHTRPEVVSNHLFRKFARAGAKAAYVVLRDGKWDIPAYFRDGGDVGLDLAYLVLEDSIGAPDTLDRAYPFVADVPVLFGFPDIILGPDDVFVQLLDPLRTTDADLVLALYIGTDPQALDMVDLDSGGRVRAIELKPVATALTLAWMCAAWAPSFSRFMHTFVARERGRSASERQAWRDPQGDLPMGAVIAAALDEGMHVCGVQFPGETFVDIGTPQRLVETLRSASS